MLEQGFFHKHAISLSYGILMGPPYGVLKFSQNLACLDMRGFLEFQSLACHSCEVLQSSRDNRGDILLLNPCLRPRILTRFSVILNTDTCENSTVIFKIWHVQTWEVLRKICKPCMYKRARF